MATSRVDGVKAPQHRETRYITHRLSIEPQNIEELTELRDYKSQVPEKLIALKKVIEEAMRNYGVCDELCYKLPEQDFKLRWDLYSWPKKITDECVELEEKCIRLENKQQIEMEEVRIPVWKSTRPRAPSTPSGAVCESSYAIDAAGRLRGSRRWRGGPAHTQSDHELTLASLAGPGGVRGDPQVLPV